MADQTENDLTALTVDLLASYVANNNVRADDLPKLISDTHGALKALTGGATVDNTAEGATQDHTAAVTPRKSLSNPEYILSMIDGKPYKSLKRHLSANGLTPDEYRQRYNLKADYPMTAPAYSERRREVAKKLGLGRKRAEPADAAAGSGDKPARKPRATKAKPEA
ncbi:putative transcriptional regulator [Sphingomonas jejuensis]|jgi:predicted transcriptional regulator|uniref:Transcriptional regulator n=1 Tax=Sphingomonas jejuensis TaxID=904715 RepID=A0ABX0XM18_9SPHN|nr:MucR family transcriptional regulator [Sphingomonas jejuensis]NJC34428.1 putative transcriptional regulator [Sphingomonas jejuensis]